MRYTDVAIVGGGLAGSTAAAMLGRAGIQALLIDPHTSIRPSYAAKNWVEIRSICCAKPVSLMQPCVRPPSTAKYGKHALEYACRVDRSRTLANLRAQIDADVRTSPAVAVLRRYSKACFPYFAVEGGRTQGCISETGFAQQIDLISTQFSQRSSGG